MIVAALSVVTTLTACGPNSSHAPAEPPAPNPPNILFILTDDVGIDQFRAFGYGGPEALNPAMPSIDRIAEAGVRFHNA